MSEVKNEIGDVKEELSNIKAGKSFMTRPILLA
jgi:hypothetical protein